ncbi:MAG: extracellular solute-binding protein [Clostridiaceae bacterium]|nr:extracellular solute-binding protein [Clostridiaceae bacterium]
MKKVLSLVLVASLSMGLLAGCGKGSSSSTSSSAPKETKTIKIFQLKVEIKDQLAKMAQEYEKEKGVKLNIETVGGGADYGAALISKFSSGDEPDIYNTTGYSDLDRVIDKTEPLTDQPWIKDMVAGAGDGVTKDGKVYGQPQAIEGFGFAYNKALFDKAGITKLPETLADLEAACQKLQAAGIQPFSNSYAEWWVLGIHNVTVLLSQQKDPDKFISGIAAGTTKIKDNEVADGWVKLLDLTKKYGQKNAFQTGDYKTSVTDFASGKAAMIQQGTWIQADIDKIDPNFKVGFLTMPTTDDASKSKVFIGVPQYWCVSKNSKVKSEAKEFLNWLVTSKTGQNYIVNEFKFLPAFKTIEAANLAPMNAAMNAYAKSGKTYTWQFAKLPAGATNVIGDSMMKYVAGSLTKDQLFTGIEKAIIDKSKK